LARISGLQEKREPVRVYNSSRLPASDAVGNGGQNPNSSIVGEIQGASTEAVATGGEARLPAPDVANNGGQVVASKNGTKYHYPWCAGAKQIAEKNKISFPSIEAARAAGYTPAANCKGLE
jgi:hypothetical protein